MNFNSSFSKVLNKIIKEEKRITISELANKLSITPAAISKWLNGGSIEIGKIQSLCKALNITPNELFGLEENDYEKAIKLYNAYINNREHQVSINKLLNLKKIN